MALNLCKKRSYFVEDCKTTVYNDFSKSKKYISVQFYFKFQKGSSFLAGQVQVCIGDRLESRIPMSWGRTKVKAQTKVKVKDSSQPKSYRFYGVMNSFSLISLISHVIFAILFGIVGIFDLAIYYALTSFLWLVIYVYNQRGYNRFAFFGGVLESVVHASLTTFLLGWHGGFYLYIIVIIPLIFINAKLKQLYKVVVALLLGLLLLILFNQSPMIYSNEIIGTYLNVLNIALAIIILAFIGHAFENSAEDAEAELLRTNKKLMNMATTDPVTNLTNRRNMMARIEKEKEKIDRGGKPFTLIMVDIDNFKHVNDEYGHDGGDFVLISLAEMISVSIRKQDQVARWGGDEFLVMLPETDLEGGRVVAEKIRQRVLRTPFVYHEKDIPVTLTFGVGLCDANSGIGSTIRKADQALYFGKQAGKNRVSIN